MLTTIVLLGALLIIGFSARSYSRRTRFLMACSIVVGILVLMRGQ